jgi:hypothetical protein
VSVPLLGASTTAVGSRASSRTAAHGPDTGLSSRTMTTAPPPRALAAESSCGLDGGARGEAGLLTVDSQPPPSPSHAARDGAPVDGAGRWLPAQQLDAREVIGGRAWWARRLLQDALHRAKSAVNWMPPFPRSFPRCHCRQFSFIFLLQAPDAGPRVDGLNTESTGYTM